MTIVVFGATGMVGKALVQQALWKNYAVKAFGRNIHELAIEHPLLTTIKGSVFSDADINIALQGADAVLSALGGGTGDTDITRSLGMKKIVECMELLSLKRIIAVGNEGVLSAAEGSYIFEEESFPLAYKAVAKEHAKAYEYLLPSSLSWTFICPPHLIDAAYSGRYQIEKNHPPTTGNHSIQVGDLAEWMVAELFKNEYIHYRVGVANI
jgi:uncharacterized protein